MKTQTTVVLVALLVACVTVQTGSSYSELERYHLINSEWPLPPIKSMIKLSVVIKPGKLLSRISHLLNLSAGGRSLFIIRSLITSKCYTLSKSTALRPLKVGVSFIAWEAIMTVEASLNGYCHRMVASRATN